MADHVHFPYRSSSHLPFLHVVAESGSWAKYGLDVDYNYKISSKDAHLEVPNEDVEFVGGNHVSTYSQRAYGDTWIYLGQTLNYTNCRLVVPANSDIAGVPDLMEKKIGTRGMHPGLNDWLYCKQRGLDVDRDDIEFVSQVPYAQGSMDPSFKDGDVERLPLWHWVRDGVVDAAFVTAPGCLQAKKAGLKVIDVDPLPMIWFTTISSSSTFIAKHPDIVERFLKGIMEGVHYFKTHPQESHQDHQGKIRRGRPARRRDRDIPVSRSRPAAGAQALSLHAGDLERLPGGDPPEQGRAQGQPHGAVGHAPRAPDRRQRIHQGALQERAPDGALTRFGTASGSGRPAHSSMRAGNKVSGGLA